MREPLRGHRSGALWSLIALVIASLLGARHYLVVWLPNQVMQENVIRCEHQRQAGRWEEGLAACATAVALAPGDATAVAAHQAVINGWLEHYYRQGEAACSWPANRPTALTALEKVFNMDATYHEVGKLRQQAIAALTPTAAPTAPPAPTSTPDATGTQVALAASATARALPSPTASPLPVVTPTPPPRPSATATDSAAPTVTALSAPTPCPTFASRLWIFAAPNAPAANP